jgi:hypothetical protein
MGGVAARVEEMAAARNLRMEGGRMQNLGKREEGRWGEGGGQRREGGGGGCPQGALREGRLGFFGGGGEVGFPPPDRDQRPKTIPTPELPTPRVHIKHTFYCFTDVYLLKFQTSHSMEPARENIEKSKLQFLFFFLNIGYHIMIPYYILTVLVLVGIFLVSL